MDRLELNTGSLISEKNILEIINKLDIEYLGYMKEWFNIEDPKKDEESLLILDEAIRFADVFKSYGVIDEKRIVSPSVLHFIKKYLCDARDEYSDESLEEVIDILKELYEKVRASLEEQKEEKKKEENERAKEAIIIDTWLTDYKRKIDLYLNSGERDIGYNSSYSKEMRDFSFSLKHYSYMEFMYKAICNDNIADFYYLHSKHDFSLKAELITACIKVGDMRRAKGLMERIINTSDYDDYDPPFSNSWEMEAKNIAVSLLRNNLPHSSLLSDITEEDTKKALELVDLLLPNLNDKSKTELLGWRACASRKEEDIKKYIQQLINDVTLYSNNRKLKAPVTNRITSEIHESFGLLEELNQIDVIIQILQIMDNAGRTLRPVSYSRMIEWCRRDMSPEAFKTVYERL